MIADLKNQWATLPPRTRALLTAALAAVTFLLLYTAIWLPLQRTLNRLRVDVPRETEQLSWMRAQVPVIQSMRANQTSVSGPLTSAIEQSAVSRGVRSFVTKLEPEGNNGARVTLEGVPFTSLITWISELQSAQGLVVDEATIDALATSGVVNARLRVRTSTT